MGRFIVPSSLEVNIETNVIINNTSRNSDTPDITQIKQSGM